MTKLVQIEQFLAERRIVMFGVSRDPKSYSHRLYNDLMARGHDIVIVHPLAHDIAGNVCYRRIEEVMLPVKAALILLPATEVEHVIPEAIEHGITRIWVRSKTGQPSVDPLTAALCEASGIALIDGHCPYMFLPRTQFPHRIHGAVLKLTGRFPR